MSIYNCDSCKDDIPEKKARIYCHYCRDNYCANCFVVQKFLGAHKNSHPTMILNFSGVVLEHAPAAMPPRPKASIAARHGTQTYEAPVLPARIQTAPVLQTGAKRYPSVETIQVPTANWGALMPVMRGFLKSKKKEAPISEHIPKPAPLPKDNPIIDTSVADIVKQEYSLPQEVPLPTSPEKDEQEADFPPECWEPMFSSDGTPQPIFVSLMSELFSSLDPKSEGSLSPEQYSAYLEVQGVDTADNIWKETLQRTNQNLDIADLELGVHFASLDIDHTLAIRSDLDHPKIGRPGENMPMLSRAGFIAIGAFETLANPDRAYSHLRLAMNEYGVWRELGKMPRNVLPERKVEREREKSLTMSEKCDVMEKGEQEILEQLEKAVLEARESEEKAKAERQKWESDSWDDISVSSLVENRPLAPIERLLTPVKP